MARKVWEVGKQRQDPTQTLQRFPFVVLGILCGKWEEWRAGGGLDRAGEGEGAGKSSLNLEPKPQPSKGMEVKGGSFTPAQHSADVPHSKPQQNEDNNPENHRKIWQSPRKPGKGDASAQQNPAKPRGVHKG